MDRDEPLDESAEPRELNIVTLPEATDTPELRIGAGSALSLTSQVVGLGTSFAVGVLVARLFGPEGKGTLSLIMQVPGLLILILDLGIGTSTLYFLSRGELRPGTAAANAIVLAAGLGVLGAPLIWLLLSGPLAVTHNVPTAALLIAMIILPVGLLATWMNSISAGLSNLALPLWYSIWSSVTTIVCLAVLLLLHLDSISAVVGVSTLGTIVGIGVLFRGLRRQIKPLRVDLAAARAAAGFSAKAYMSSLAGLLHERQDILFLGWLSGAASVGLYSVGVSFAELTWFIPSALSAAILAKGSRRGDESAIDYTTRTSRVAVLFMTVVIAASLILVPLVIPFVYGKAFAPAIFAFFALLPGVFADGVSRILWSYQVTRGRLYWMLSVGTSLLNLVAILLLVPRLGAVGAGLASTVSYSALAVLTVARFHNDTGAHVADVFVPRRDDVAVILRTAKQLIFRKNREP